MTRAKRQQKLTVMQVNAKGVVNKSDTVITEEPLEIRLEAEQVRTLAITMRTPGHDFELVAGYLFSEGVVQQQQDIKHLSYCLDAQAEQHYNVVKATLKTLPVLEGLERHVYISSACGVCGKTSLEALDLKGFHRLEQTFSMKPEVITALPDRLRASQNLFSNTGGLHAAAIFSQAGELLALREDVGRHNALDKLLGWALLNQRLPLSEYVLLLSGRVSYELMQKALSAGIQVVCAISAPSSLAVSVAKRFNITLVGFLRGERFNVYSTPERLEIT